MKHQPKTFERRETVEDPVADRPRVSSEDLMQGQKRITIEHEGNEYTLHLTRQNKLLLTK